MRLIWSGGFPAVPSAIAGILKATSRLHNGIGETALRVPRSISEETGAEDLEHRCRMWGEDSSPSARKFLHRISADFCVALSPRLIGFASSTSNFQPFSCGLAQAGFLVGRQLIFGPPPFLQLSGTPP